MLPSRGAAMLTLGRVDLAASRYDEAAKRLERAAQIAARGGNPYRQREVERFVEEFSPRLIAPRCIPTSKSPRIRKRGRAPSNGPAVRPFCGRMIT